MNSIVAFFMSIVTFFGTLFGVVAADPILPAETDDFVPVIRFVACSDTHVNDTYEENERAGRITKLFNLGYEFAEKDKYYNNLDAVMFVGDCTDNGTETQFATFENEIKAGIREGTTLLAVVANNHDGYIGASCLDSIEAITGLDSDFHVVINGYHFIGISCSDKDVGRYELSQRTWLKKQLDEAVKDDPDKPIFVCNHEHVVSTVYGSDPLDQWGILYFKDILSQYPQVVHFSGHSHYPLNDPRSIVQNGYTTIGTGSMSYVEYRYKLDIKIRPEGKERCAQAWIVEADKDNNIRLTGIDVNDGGILCQYVIPTAAEKDERFFTKDNLKSLSSAPEFAADAKLTAVNNGDGTYTVTAPKAESTDGFIVLAYIIKVYNKAGMLVKTDHNMNDYFLTVPRDETSFTVDAKAGYKVEVTAENAYYMASEPLCLTLE